MLQLGLPDRFIDHGEQAEFLPEDLGLDAAGIEASIRARFLHLLLAQACSLFAARTHTMCLIPLWS